jgi:hypothetical protein
MTQRVACIVGLTMLFAFSMARFVYDLSGKNDSADDLVSPWVSTKVFAEGKNPYNDTAEFDRIASEIRTTSPASCPADSCALDRSRMIYPPSVFPLLSPLSLLPWRAAYRVYVAGSLFLVLAMIFMLAQELQLPWSEARKSYMIAFSMALAPLHASIHVSNLNTLVIGCLGMGVIFLHKRPHLSGVALAIGMCLKPQVAFVLFAYPWLRRQWKAAFTGLIACSTILASSLLWMWIHHVAWWQSYMGLVIRPYLFSATSISTTQKTAVLSFYDPGPMKYLMTNLQVLVFQFVHSQHWANVLSWALFLFLAAFSALLIVTKVSERNERIGIAIASVLTLLPVYQNFYTASILIFVVCWAVDGWPRRSAKAALLLMWPLLLPLVAMTWRVSSIARVVENHHLSSHFFWNALIMPHVIWIELILLSILLGELYHSASISGEPVELRR